MTLNDFRLRNMYAILIAGLAFVLNQSSVTCDNNRKIPLKLWYNNTNTSTQGTVWPCEDAVVLDMICGEDYIQSFQVSQLEPPSPTTVSQSERKNIQENDNHQSHGNIYIMFWTVVPVILILTILISILIVRKQRGIQSRLAVISTVIRNNVKTESTTNPTVSVDSKNVGEVTTNQHGAAYEDVSMITMNESKIKTGIPLQRVDTVKEDKSTSFDVLVDDRNEGSKTQPNDEGDFLVAMPSHVCIYEHLDIYSNELVHSTTNNTAVYAALKGAAVCN